MFGILFTYTHRKFKMATTKTFKVVGVSTFGGTTKIRFANDTSRVKILVKNGHTSIDLFELPTAMCKGAALQYVKANALFVIPADSDVTAENILAAVGE